MSSTVAFALTPMSLSGRISPQATATAPIPATVPLRTRPQVRAYEKFLKECPPAKRAALDAPVYETADGGLVCQWDAEDAKLRKTFKAMREYEMFLNSEMAEGVDLTRPVFLAQYGLVCELPQV